jgi:hypothetical protein
MKTQTEQETLFSNLRQWSKGLTDAELCDLISGEGAYARETTRAEDKVLQQEAKIRGL